MIFNSVIDTPANTSQSTPVVTDLKVMAGLIYQVDFYFPPGSSGLMGLQVRSQNVAIYPRNRESFFIGDNAKYSFPDLFQLNTDSNILQLLTYNTDTDYSHQLSIRIGIVSRSEYIEHFLPGEKIGELKQSIDALTAALTVNTAENSRSIINKILGK